MYKALTVLLASVALSGCAMTTKWDSTYEDYGNELETPKLDVQLTTNHIPRFLDPKTHQELKVFVNGNLALETPINADYSGSIMFFYDEDQFQLECLKPNFWSYSECAVEINGRRAGKVKFEV